MGNQVEQSELITSTEKSEHKKLEDIKYVYTLKTFQ